jgi:hypothetical protein
MVRRARYLRFRPLEYAGAGLVLASVVAFLIVVIGGKEAGWSEWSLVLPLALFASGVVLLILRSVLPRSFDPNTADLESRIRLGRRRAISKEAYEAGEFPPAADPLDGKEHPSWAAEEPEPPCDISAVPKSAVEPLKTCPKCGTPPLSQSAQACRFCGAKLP